MMMMTFGWVRNERETKKWAFSRYSCDTRNWTDLTIRIVCNTSIFSFLLLLSPPPFSKYLFRENSMGNGRRSIVGERKRLLSIFKMAGKKEWRGGESRRMHAGPAIEWKGGTPLTPFYRFRVISARDSQKTWGRQTFFSVYKGPRNT